MGKLIDLTGRKFGALTVLYRAENRKQQTMWHCLCDCGVEKDIGSNNLLRGLTKSCGYCAKRIDLKGQRFGRLIAIQQIAEPGQQSKWLCQCDCGNTTEVVASSLREGLTRSCGCLIRDTAVKTCQQRATHKETKTRLYRVWQGMKRRVHNPHTERYKCYGGRGIKICAEWDSSYEAFRDWALSTGYDPDAPYGKCTIDRIDVNGNYEPNNCRWATIAEQAKNTRKTVKHNADQIFSFERSANTRRSG